MGDVQPHEWNKDIFDEMDRRYDDMPNSPPHKIWRDLCGFSQDPAIYQGVNAFLYKITHMLDTLESMHPIPKMEDGVELDKFGRLSVWINTAPLLRQETGDAKWFIANQIC